MTLIRRLSKLEQVAAMQEARRPPDISPEQAELERRIVEILSRPEIDPARRLLDEYMDNRCDRYPKRLLNDEEMADMRVFVTQYNDLVRELAGAEAVTPEMLIPDGFPNTADWPRDKTPRENRERGVGIRP